MIVTYNKSGSYTGWIGNRIFQCASTLGIAIKNNMDYIFPPCEYYNYFKGIIPQSNVANMKAFDYQEPFFHYTEVILNPVLDYNLKGYYQSEKYWIHCKEKILDIFTFKDEVVEYMTSKYQHVFNQPDTIFVSVHVRRGDYLKHPDSHPVLTMQYYLSGASIAESLKTLGKKIKYVIFSDDIAWCKENFVHDIFKDKLIFSEGNSPAHDMCLMSMCDYHIIANSSFSWWGSYLNRKQNKIVIAPTKDKWFGKAYKDWSIDDLYLNNWILA